MFAVFLLLFAASAITISPGPNAGSVSVPTLLIVAVAFLGEAVMRWVVSTQKRVPHLDDIGR